MSNGLASLLRNPRRLQQFAETPGNYPAALAFAGAGQGRVAGRAAPRASKSEEEAGVLETGEVIDKVKLPDGSYVAPATQSGQIVKVPGKSNLFVDPATGEPFQADPTKPTGLRSAFDTARKVARGGKLFAVVPGVGEREVGTDPEAEKKAQEQAAKRDAENVRLGYAKEKRPYNIDRVTGRPVPTQTDEEWAKAKQEKADKLAQAAHLKKLKAQADKLDLDADRLSLTAPKASPEEAAAYDAAVSSLEGFAAGKDLDTAAEELANAPDSEDEDQNAAKATAQSYLSLRDKVKPAKDAEAQAKELKLRALDLKEQMLDPDAWKAGKTSSLAEMPDADLQAEAKAQADIITEQETEAQGTLELVAKGRADLEQKHAAFMAERQAAEAQGLSLEQKQALDAEQAQLEAEIKDYDDWNAEAVTSAQGSLKASQDRWEVLAAAGAEIDRRNKAATEQFQAQAEKAAVLGKAKPLYDWAKDNFHYTDDYRGMNDYGILDAEAKKAGLDPKQAREALQTFRQLDWSNPRRDAQTGQPIAEESRLLPDGRVTINPGAWGDFATYTKAVEASGASEAAKKQALEQFPQLQEIYAEKAVDILSKSANIPGQDNFMKWRERKIEEDQAQKGALGFTRKSPARQAIEYMDEMKNRSWFRKAGEQIVSGLLVGSADIATQVLGDAAMLTGSETIADLAAANSANSESVVGAQSLEGSDTDYALRIMGMGARMAPGVAAIMAGAGAIGGGVTAASILSGAQTAGGMFADIYRKAKDEGLSHGEAWRKAALPSAFAGAITGLLTRGMGATGLERVFADPVAKEAAKGAFKTYLGQFAKAAAEELPEETADEFFSQIIQGAAESADPAATLKNYVENLPELAGVSALMGGAGGLMQGQGNAPAAGPEGMAPMPAQPQAPAPTPGPMAPAQISQPAQTGDIAGAINAFTPTGEAMLPQAVADTVKRTNRTTEDVSRAAASGLVKVAQGASLESLDAREREALGFVSKDGKIIPAPKTTPLVETYKGKLVIRNEAAEWLDDEGQPLLARQIRLDEAERKAQIDEAEAKPAAKKKAGQAKEKAAESQTQGSETVITGDSLSSEASSTLAPATISTQEAETAAIAWDNANKNRATSEWFDGDKMQNKAFNEAANAGANNLQAHGMAKEATLTGAVRNLFKLLQNGVDPNRGGGQLYTAQLALAKGQQGVQGATSSGTAYRDGPFILVQNKEGSAANKGITDTSSIAAILVNEANVAQIDAIRKAIHAIRPDIIVAPYSQARQVTESILGKTTQQSAPANEPQPQAAVSPEPSVRQVMPESRQLPVVPEQPPAPAQETAPEPEPAAGGGLTPAQAARATPAQKAKAARKKAQAVPANQVTARQEAPTAPVDEAAAQAATSPASPAPEPSEAQKEAGNYKKGHAKIGGLDISIENEAGTKRRPEWGALSDHYGYIKGTVDNTGEQADVFIKPGTPEDYAGPVFVVTQNDPKTGKFDEFKTIIGYDTAAEAEQAYRSNYTADWQGFGGIQEMSLDEFKAGLADMTAKEKAAREAKSAEAGQLGERGILPKTTNTRRGDMVEVLSGPLKGMRKVEGYDLSPNGRVFVRNEKTGMDEPIQPDNWKPAEAGQPVSQAGQAVSEPAPATPLAKAKAAIAAYTAKAIAEKKAAKDDEAKNAANRKIVGAAWLAKRLNAFDGVVEYEVAKEDNGKPIEGMMVKPTLKGGLLVINPEGLINLLSKNNLGKDALYKAIDKFLVHEFIHEAALSRLTRSRIIDLYNSLTNKAKEDSRRLYLAQAGEGQGELDEFQAAHEWFAQLVEARMSGEISNQALIEASDDPAFRDKLAALFREFVAALRDIAGLVKDPAMAEQIRAEADAVEAAVRQMAEKAGLAEALKAEQAKETPGIPAEGKYSVYQAGGRWLVQQSDKRGFGDHLFDSEEEAVTESLRQQDMARKNAEFLAKQEAAAKAAQEAEEARLKPLNDYLDALGLSAMQRGKLKTALSADTAKQSRETGKIYQGTRFNAVQEMVADGFRAESEQVPAIKEPTGIQWNRMNNQQQAEFERKRKAAGMTTQYSLALPSGSMFVVTKAEHDYAKWLAERQAPAPAQPAEQAAQAGPEEAPPVTAQPPAVEPEAQPASQAPAAEAGQGREEAADKPPVGYGDEPAPPAITAPGVRYNDIPLELARQAHSGTSFVPDVRARGEQRQYVAYMNSVWADLEAKAATDEQKATAKAEFEQYRQKYVERYKALLRSNAGIVSSMIAGPARFPVARMQKRNEAYHAKLEEFLAWDKKAKAKIANTINPQPPAIISSDLKNAPDLLRQDIEDAKKRQEMMKQGNALIRKLGTDKAAMAEGLRKLGFTDKEIASRLNPPSGYGLGWQSFTLTNNLANIKRMEERLKGMENLRATAAREATFEGGRVEENADLNRVQIFFDAKPGREMIDKLKANGFKWAPSQGSWQRQRTNAAVYAAESVLGVKMAAPAQEGQTEPEPAEIGPATPQPLPADEGGQPGLANPPGRPGQEAGEAQAAELEEAANEAVREAADVQETSDMMDQLRKDAEAADALRNNPEAVAAVQASGAMSGRNLSQQFTFPAARELYRALTAARDMVGGPPTVVFDEMRKWAAQQVQADPDKAIAFATEKADEKASMKPEEQAVLSHVIEHLNRVVAMTGDKATRLLLHRLANYYLDLGTLTAQTMAGRRDPLETPQDRWNKALTVIFGPDSKVRRRLALAPTAATKARRIAELEAQLASYQGARKSDIEAALSEARVQETQEEILERSDAANEKLKSDILKKVGIMEQDMTLSTVDRYSLQTAILELPAVRESLDKFDNGRDIMRLAFQGRSDSHIAGALQINEADVAKFIEEVRNGIIRPALAAEVKAGKGWGEMIRSGFDSLARKVGLRMAAVSGPLGTLAPPLTQQQQQDIERKVNDILNYALQPARRRNKAGSLIAKVIDTPGGKKVRVFVPFDPEDMASFYAVAREFSAAKASVTDKLYEYWINWPLLSGPQTQVANLTGNAANVLWHYTAQRMVEAGMNVLYRDPNSAKLGEFKHVAKAFMGSIMPALDMARQSFLTEGDSVRHKYLGEPMEIEFKDGSLDKVGAYRPSIGGKAGQLARLPGRLLRFTDAFFKTSILHMEATAIAYRSAAYKAKQQGLTGKNRDAFLESEIANALANPGSQVWAEANKTAEELLFQDENAATDLVDTLLMGNKGVRDLEKLMAEAEAKGDNEGAAKLRNRIFWRKVVGKIFRIIFPFQRTPTNIIKVGLRKAGGSAVVGLWHAARAGLFKVKDGEAFLKNYTKAMQIKDVSESLLAGLGWMMLASMFEGDDDDEKKPILIVGNRPYAPGTQGEREAFLRSTGGANSILFRDKEGKVITSFNFSRYEPVATLLSAWVDGYRNYMEVNRRRKQGEADASYLRFIGSSLMASVEGKSFLQGFSGIMETLRDFEERRDTTTSNWAAKQLINSAVPNLIKQPLRNWDDLIRDTKTAGIGYTGLPNPEIAPKLPAFAAEPKVTATGERIRKGFSPPARLLFQANAVVKPQPDALLLRANRLNPVASWYPQPLQADDYYVRQPGAKRGTPGYKTPIADPAAKRRFAELDGKLYADAARRITATATPAERAKPTESLIEKFKKAREQARSQARVMGGMIGLQKSTTPAITTPNK